MDSRTQYFKTAMITNKSYPYLMIHNGGIQEVYVDSPLGLELHTEHLHSGSMVRSLSLKDEILWSMHTAVSCVFVQFNNRRQVIEQSSIIMSSCRVLRDLLKPIIK